MRGLRNERNGHRRLVLIEGMVGAGKSTTAERLARWLIERGDDARAFHEFADDHPIRTETTDRLRGVIAAPDPGAYDVSQWSQLAARCLSGRQLLILESAFLQNSVLPAFAADAPIETVKSLFAQIEARIAPADPLLIYLRPIDISAAVARVHAERGEPWSSRNLAAVASFAWSRARGLSGQQAVIEFYRAWEQVVDELFALSICQQVLVSDPQSDWPTTLQRIFRLVA